MGIYLIYRVNEYLGIITKEISNHLDLVVVREDGCYERGALMRGKGVASQPFPGRGVTAHDYAVKQMDTRSPE